MSKPAAVKTVVVEQSTISVDAVVVGPNIKSRTGEMFHVHSPRCADRKRPMYAGSELQSCWDNVEQFSSVQDLIENVEQDIMREHDQVFGPGATDFENYRSEFKIYPCVKGLPDREPLTEAQLAEAAKPARKTRAAKPALDVAALTGADELFYSCAVCGAVKGARCTQRSGRVKTYFHSDRTKAVEAFTTSK